MYHSSNVAGRPTPIINCNIIYYGIRDDSVGPIPIHFTDTFMFKTLHGIAPISYFDVLYEVTGEYASFDNLI